VADLLLPPAQPCPGRAALVIAHPGHELRVHGWLELARPRVFVLTDGSGRTGRSRLASTLRVLAAAGAEPGSVCGRLTDAALYDAILRRDLPFFRALADELAEALDEHDVDYVAGDAAEGYSSGHDVCRLLIDAAVALVNRQRDRPMLNYDFLLDGPPNDWPKGADQAIRIRLTRAAFERKLAAARNYPEMAGEVERAVRRLGTEAFRVECLRPVAAGTGPGTAPGVPYYERYGERQVAAGHYRRVIRLREHILPLARALREHAAKSIRARAPDGDQAAAEGLPCAADGRSR
jgi:hypothetical protein